MWSAITTFTLKTLEGMKKSEVSKIIEGVRRRRLKDEQRGRDGQRRIILSNIIEEDYPTIFAAANPDEKKKGKKDKKKDKKKELS